MRSWWGRVRWPKSTASMVWAAVPALVCGLGAGVAQGADLDAVRSLSAADFRAVSEDLGAAVAYRPLMPAEASGVTGFDLGVSVGAISLAQRESMVRAAGGASVPSSPAVYGVHAVKGLPLNLDVGVFAMGLAGTNVRASGGELRWAFVPGGVATPALALRLAGSVLRGVDDLSLRTWSADLSVSKGFAFVTPFAGAGVVGVRSAVAGSALPRQQFTMTRVFGGVNIAFVPFALVLQAERTGDTTGASAKVALRW